MDNKDEICMMNEVCIPGMKDLGIEKDTTCVPICKKCGKPKDKCICNK